MDPVKKKMDDKTREQDSRGEKSDIYGRRSTTRACRHYHVTIVIRERLNRPRDTYVISERWSHLPSFVRKTMTYLEDRSRQRHHYESKTYRIGCRRVWETLGALSRSRMLCRGGLLTIGYRLFCGNRTARLLLSPSWTAFMIPISCLHVAISSHPENLRFILLCKTKLRWLCQLFTSRVEHWTIYRFARGKYQWKRKP